MSTEQAFTSSIRKTMRLLVVAAVGASAAAVAAAEAGGWLGVAVAVPLLAGAVVLGWLAHAGRVTEGRQRRVDRGEPDLFLQRNAARSEHALRSGIVKRPGVVRRWLALALFGQRLLVGDTVVVESLAAIRAGLDVDGCLDGLPFMREMEAYCGRTMRVYRVVDKIYDYGRSRLMRRLDDSVLLLDLRCDGSDHGGCEAACYLIWKTAWLRRVDPHAGSAGTAPERASGTSSAPSAPPPNGVFRCQYTQLTSASQPMRQFGLRLLLAPLMAGNVTFAAFVLALQTRCFNALQRWRGGATYPAMPTPSDDRSLRWDALQPGDRVRVKTPTELAPAMNRNSKHRGLWFDRDMLKHCGQERRVRTRIEKIIDIHSGRMIPMKTPCIVLEGVDYSGEFQGFGEQHDYLYWREAWLTPLDAPRASQAAARVGVLAK